jgi:hypothetical protein
MLVITRPAGAQLKGDFRITLLPAPGTELTAKKPAHDGTRNIEPRTSRGSFLGDARACPSTNPQLPQDPFRGFTAFEHRGDHEIGAAHHVAAGEDLRIRRLKRSFLRR